jgi:hypothetical protein
MIKKKPMTLDALARLVAGGFEEAKANLKAAEERIRKDMVTKMELHDLEHRLMGDIRGTASQVVYQIVHAPDSPTERRFGTIEKRIGKLEKQAR